MLKKVVFKLPVNVVFQKGDEFYMDEKLISEYKISNLVDIINEQPKNKISEGTK